MTLPAVLVPGLQSDHRSWIEQLRHFTDRREVVVPAEHQHCWSIAEMGEVILPQLPERFHLVPWSMGGYVMLQLMPRIADRVASLVLMATSARPENPDSTARRHDLIRIAERRGMYAASRRSLAFSCLDVDRVAPDVREAVAQSSVDLGLDAYRGQQHAIINRGDVRANLGLIRCPTLVVVGADDEVTPPDCAAELHAAIAGARLVTLAGCGHCPPLEQPAAVNTMLDDWFSRHDARVPA